MSYRFAIVLSSIFGLPLCAGLTIVVNAIAQELCGDGCFDWSVSSLIADLVMFCGQFVFDFDLLPDQWKALGVLAAAAVGNVLVFGGLGGISLFLYRRAKARWSRGTPLLSENEAIRIIEGEIAKLGWAGFDLRQFLVRRRKGRLLWRCLGAVSRPDGTIVLRGSAMLIEIDARNGEVVRAVASPHGLMGTVPFEPASGDEVLIPRDKVEKIVEAEITSRSWSRYDTCACSLWRRRGRLLWGYSCWDLSASNARFYFDIDARTGEVVTAYWSGEPRASMSMRRRAIPDSA
jgi:hypothetical protein